MQRWGLDKEMTMKGNSCIRIGHLKIIDHLILGLAGLQMEKDGTAFRAYSLKPAAMHTWDQICDGLTGGELNGAFITAPLAMDLFAAGLDIRILMFTHRSGSVFVKKKDAGINSLVDFKGKTVLVPTQLCVQNMLLHKFLSSAGLSIGSHNNPDADVVCEAANPLLMTEMLMNDSDNDIAGFIASEPFGRDAVFNGIAANICPSEQMWHNHPCSAFVLKSSVIQDHPDAVKEIIRLFVRTGRFIENTKDDEVLSWAQHFLCQKKEVVRHVLLETGVCFEPSLLIPDRGSLDIIKDYMARTMGILNPEIDMNLLIEPSFIMSPDIA